MICKKPNCKKELPITEYHFSNQLAVENGYCSWTCMVNHLGEEAWEKLRNYIKNADARIDKNVKAYQEWKKKMFANLNKKS